MATTIPIGVENYNKLSNKILPGQWYAQDGTDKTWTVILIQKLQPGTMQGTTSYEYRYYKYLFKDGRNETDFANFLIGVDIVTGANEAERQKAAVKKDNYKKAKKELESVITGANRTGEDPDATLNNTPIPTSEIDGVQWNPPPHKITRPPSFYTMANIGSNAVIPSTARSKEVLKSLGGNINKLGKVYQNKSSAVALNKKKGLTEANAKASDLWGFRFTYNPTRISYGSTIDTAIDWMLQPKDPSNFFGGNTEISFDLYLNRIADMSTLRKGDQIITQSYPGRGLTPVEKNGILKRGTEYDLEFLYRVVNGRPGGTSLVSDTTLLTSDYGYITGMPVWIQFHENMRYRGSLRSIQVEHVIFTEDMIPMLSVVKLAFIRYPELDTLSKKDRKKIETQLEANSNTSETTDR